MKTNMKSVIYSTDKEELIRSFAPSTSCNELDPDDDFTRHTDTMIMQCNLSPRARKDNKESFAIISTLTRTKVKASQNSALPSYYPQ